ncbi:MAG: anaerobic ribonucleoside-triphosphate reductase activating protein [Clostridiales bacterium]|nr:anaerobic ribonucleoside-triphosphate reductase activating protein [Clostridiales bacterium]
MEEPTVLLAGVVQDSIVDGPGLRLAVFTQGCPHACPGCHNPETHPFEGGTPTTVRELLQKLQDNPLQTGVTLSGGEPFCQAAPLAAFAAACKRRGLEVAAYSGYTFEELLELGRQDPGVPALLQQLDTLIDGRFVQALRSHELRFRGSANQRTVDVPKSLAAGRAVLDTSARWNG